MFSLPADIKSLFKCRAETLTLDGMFENNFTTPDDSQVTSQALIRKAKGQTAKMNDFLLENSAPYIGAGGLRKGLAYEVVQYNCATVNGASCDPSDMTMKTVQKGVRFELGRMEPRVMSYADRNGSLTIAPALDNELANLLRSKGTPIKRLAPLLGWDVQMRVATSNKEDERRSMEEKIRYFSTTALGAVGQSNYAEDLQRLVHLLPCLDCSRVRYSRA